MASGAPKMVFLGFGKFARADNVAQNLDRFFSEQSRNRGQEGKKVSLVGSREGNILISVHVNTGEQRSLVKDIFKSHRAEDIASAGEASPP